MTTQSKSITVNFWFGLRGLTCVVVMTILCKALSPEFGPLYCKEDLIAWKLFVNSDPPELRTQPPKSISGKKLLIASAEQKNLWSSTIRHN